MSISGQSIVDLSLFSPALLFSLFKKAEKALVGGISSSQARGRSISLVFFEDSTRTRVSFEIAAHKLGISTSYFGPGQGTSLNKGESPEETLRTIASMDPDLIVVRAAGDFPLLDLESELSIPLINGGWGAKGHPTQALLDLFTLWLSWKDLSNKRIVFVGDIKHSRVVSSHMEILRLLGVEVAFCAPPGFMPDIIPEKSFADIGEAADWADALIALRVQKERHSGGAHWDFDEFRSGYAVTSERLTNFKKDLLIMHPAPFNLGVEIDSEVLKDSRCLIHRQIRNGVYLRAALIDEVLNLEVIK